MSSTIKKRKYEESCIQYGFTSLAKDGIDLPQCVLCLKSFDNGSMKPFQLKQHLEESHGEQTNKQIEYFKCKEGVKRSRLDNAGAFFQTTHSIVEASYAVALRIEKLKKPHNIGETLVNPCQACFGRHCIQKLKKFLFRTIRSSAELMKCLATSRHSSFHH